MELEFCFQWGPRNWNLKLEFPTKLDGVTLSCDVLLQTALPLQARSIILKD
jgi:hypothetical protein